MDQIKNKRLAVEWLRSMGVILLGLVLILGLSACETLKPFTGSAKSKNLFPDKKPTVADVQTNPADKVKKADKQAIIQKVMKLQMPFIANEGQAAKEVSFYAKTFGGTAYVTEKGEMVYSFPRIEPKGRTKDIASSPQNIKGVTLKETLVGASVTNPQGKDRAQTKVNYFIGNNKSKWKTDISTYNSIFLEEIYKGIDLSLKAYGKTMEKVFTVAPGSDPNVIKLKIEGTESLRINDKGELELETDLGVVRFSEPVAYQEKNGKRETINVAYHLYGDNYGFIVDNYDKSFPLIIDPILNYSTYFGVINSDDSANNIAVDVSGNVYITGRTNSASGIATTGSYETTYGGSNDVFVTKFDPTLSVISYSTYIGGTGADSVNDIAVDGENKAYVIGTTSSIDFPTTPSTAYQNDNGGSSDAFVTILNSTGSDLLYSTYLGGSNSDSGWSIAIDSLGDFCFTGTTHSSDFPVVNGGLFGNSLSGSSDAFVAKISPPNAYILNYSILLGGSYSGSENEEGRNIAVDSSDNVYVAGWTPSSDFPTTTGAYDTTFGGNLRRICYKDLME